MPTQGHGHTAMQSQALWRPCRKHSVRQMSRESEAWPGVESRQKDAMGTRFHTAGRARGLSTTPREAMRVEGEAGRKGPHPGPLPTHTLRAGSPRWLRPSPRVSHCPTGQEGYWPQAEPSPALHTQTVNSAQTQGGQKSGGLVPCSTGPTLSLLSERKSQQIKIMFS